MKARTRDGAEIFYEVYDFTDQRKSAETILLHHGLRGSYRLWYNWVPLLAGHYRVIAVDARGRGESTIPPPGFDWSMEQFATDDLAVLDAAGVERVHYVGASFGGVVGEYLGARYPDRLRTLTLVSAPYRFTQLGDVVDRWLSEMASLGTAEFLRRDVQNMFPPGAGPGLVAWHTEQMASVPAHVAADMLRFMAGVNLADLLPSIAVPTLMLAAAQSDRAPSGESEFMQRQIPGIRAVMLNSHHNISATMPERCVEVILPFLREHAGR